MIRHPRRIGNGGGGGGLSLQQEDYLLLWFEVEEVGHALVLCRKNAVDFFGAYEQVFRRIGGCNINPNLDKKLTIDCKINTSKKI